MDVFVVGATGYIGGAIVDHLLDQGHSVTGLARSDESVRRLRGKGAAAHRGHIGADDAWLDVARRADAVVFAWLPADGADFADPDSAAVRAVLAGLRDTGKAFVYVTGSLGTGDTGTETVVDEHTTADPPPFLAWRSALEDTIRDAARTGVRTVVVRAPMVYGRRAGFMTTSLQADVATSGTVHYVGTGDNLLAFVHVDDLAALVVRAVEKAPPGALYLAANDEVLAYRDFAEQAAAALGATGTASLPVAVAAAAMGPFAEALTYSQRLSTAAAREQLGWRPERPGVIAEFRTLGRAEGATNR
jgi:nucleoside-diphosphate-sugar epimerase